MGRIRGRVMYQNFLKPTQPSISAASKVSGLMPIMAAISMMAVLPNHIRKFMKPMMDRVPKVVPRKSTGFFKMPRFIRMEFTGPLVEKMVKNSMAKAEAMIRLGR